MKVLLELSIFTPPIYRQLHAILGSALADSGGAEILIF